LKKDFITDHDVDTASLVKALDLIEKSKYILIITHINPDADTISSALAISNFLFENKIKHKVYNIGKNLPQNLDFINRFEKSPVTLKNRYLNPLHAFHLSLSTLIR